MPQNVLLSESQEKPAQEILPPNVRQIEAGARVSFPRRAVEHRDELRHRRLVFFALRGVLCGVIVALLAYSSIGVSPKLWLLGIGFLVSNLLILLLPLHWFRNSAIPHVAFFLDLGALTAILYSVSGIQSESLLLYYLTIFMATLGENVQNSVGIAFGTSAIYVWLRLSGQGNLLASPEALMRIPLFFITALSSGYLAQEARTHKKLVHGLRDLQGALQLELDRSLEDLARSEDLRAIAQASLQRFRDLVEDLDAIVWEADAPTLQFTYVSRRAEEVLGYPVEQWIKHPAFWSDQIHPEDREQTISSLRQAVYAGQGHEFEYRMMAADGRAVWLQNIVHVARDAGGQALRLRGLMVDITERKQAEELDRFFTLSYDMLCIAGFDGYFKRLNNAWEKTLGFAQQELLAKPYLELVHPEDRPSTTSEAQKLAAGLITVCFENRYISKDGSYRWLRWTAAPSPERRLIYAVARDITKQKQTEDEIKKLNDELEQRVVERTAQFLSANESLQNEISERERAEEALRTSEESLRLLVSGVKDYAIFMLDPEGRVASWNEGAEGIKGYGAPEIIGQHFRRFYPEEDAEQGRPEQQLNLAASKGRVEDEGWRIRKDGSRFLANVVITALRDENGRLRGFSTVTRDITERRQLEEQFRQAQKMEAIGRLAGGVAHDFNNLLTIITGYSQLLLSRLGEADPARAPVDEISKAGERAGMLTRQLLAFSRRQTLAPQVLQLNGVISNMEKMLRRLIGEDIQLVIVKKADLGHVKADPGQIEQVIMNLAVNARDAMPRGGSLTLELANVDLDEQHARTLSPVAPGTYVELTVSDTGCGMDPETKKHIFEPFFTTKEKGKGTGLGLATVYGIVKQSGGYIWVYSEPGQGATFKIYLPRVEEAPAAVQPGKSLAPALTGSETVLLVEDEGSLRALVKGMLEAGGYQVLEARDGADAMVMAHQHEGPIHLLLTDVVMPGISGKELAERLAFQRPEAKVLYVSGYTEGVIDQHGVLDPNTPFLQKPFTPDSLARKVRDVLDH